MANTRSITGANAILMLSISSLYNVPVQIQGFAADDVFDLPEIKPAEIQPGVDGRMSAGWIYVPIPQTIVLQADSVSNDIFEQWYAAQQTARELFFATGVVHLNATSRSYVLNHGALSSYKPAPEVKKYLQARRFEITWESVVPAPI